jgi:hypothetical protein
MIVQVLLFKILTVDELSVEAREVGVEVDM